MTDIRELMEDATPLPWKVFVKGQPAYDHVRQEDDRLTVASVNALPAVLEYMKNGHVDNCFKPEGCICGYDNLCKVLGVDGE